MKYPNPLMALYTGIADAWAFPAEYIKLPEHQSIIDRLIRFQEYCDHPIYPIGAGRYTDDTEMTVANMKVLTYQDGPYKPIVFANAYVEEFLQGGSRKGYSRGFQAILEKVNTGEQLIKLLKTDSVGNGAAMRAHPIGVLKNISDVLEVATIQASVTHNTPDGLFSARAIALISHYAHYVDEPLHSWRLLDYCLSHLPKEDIDRFGYIFRTSREFRPVKATKSQSVAVDTVHAVLDLLICYANFPLRAILKEIIFLGGDTDTVAAITLGIISCRKQDPFESGLPPFMFVDLEGGDRKTGAKYLIDVGKRFMEKYNQP